MIQQVNKAYQPLFTQRPRYFILMGGRGAGRSKTASQYALAKLVAPGYFRCAIMRFVLGDVRNSIFQDILDTAEEREVDAALNIREHNLTITHGSNRISGIGFRKSSSEQKSKLKSLAGFSDVIIEEADEVSEEDFMQLDDSLRTTKSNITIFLLLNAPPKNHWIIKRFFNLVSSGVEGFYKAELKPELANNTVYISTDYTANLENLNSITVENFERYKKTKPDHYWNMIKGLVSEGKRGRIFKTWTKIPDAEFHALPYTSIYGLDFGFTNDPTALIETKRHNNKIWLNQRIYETGLTNPAIGRRFETLGLRKGIDKVYGDSSEPKSIKEIRDMGWNIEEAIKGPGSVNAGLDMLLDEEIEIYFTESSTDIDTETQEYTWRLDKNKESTNDPIDDFNHAMDATRYAIYSEAHKPFIGVV